MKLSLTTAAILIASAALAEGKSHLRRHEHETVLKGTNYVSDQAAYHYNHNHPGMQYKGPGYNGGRHGYENNPGYQHRARGYNGGYGGHGGYGGGRGGGGGGGGACGNPFVSPPACNYFCQGGNPVCKNDDEEDSADYDEDASADYDYGASTDYDYDEDEDEDEDSASADQYYAEE